MGQDIGTTGSDKIQYSGAKSLIAMCNAFCSKVLFNFKRFGVQVRKNDRSLEFPDGFHVLWQPTVANAPWKLYPKV